MTHKFGERQVHAFLRATRSAIDPTRNILAASTPYVIGGGVGPASQKLIAASAISAHNVDADYIHLEFERDAEVEGPVNVKVGMFRSGVVSLFESCRFWLGEDGAMLLIATAGRKAATMSFDPEGMDSRPGLPAGDLEGGYVRAEARLRELADKAAASGDFGPILTLKTAA